MNFPRPKIAQMAKRYYGVARMAVYLGLPDMCLTRYMTFHRGTYESTSLPIPVVRVLRREWESNEGRK